MAGPEVRSQALEGYKNFNKLTLTGALGIATIAAFTPALTPLIGPALGLAVVDASQIVFINSINKKK